MGFTFPFWEILSAINSWSTDTSDLLLFSQLNPLVGEEIKEYSLHRDCQLWGL